MAAMMRTSTRTLSFEPSGMNSRSCRTRSSFTWISGPMVPISSKKIVPRLAVSNKPLRLAMAPVNDPLTCPNKSGFQQFGG